jgi:hypothetical protein
MDTPNFGAILWDAVKSDVAMIWSSWPTWSNEHPIIWVIPALMIFGVAGAVWPKKRRTR